MDKIRRFTWELDDIKNHYFCCRRHWNSVYFALHKYLFDLESDTYLYYNVSIQMPVMHAPIK